MSADGGRRQLAVPGHRSYSCGWRAGPPARARNPIPLRSLKAASPDFGVIASMVTSLVCEPTASDALLLPHGANEVDVSPNHEDQNAFTRHGSGWRRPGVAGA